METLNKFGFAFQIKCITALLHDNSFVANVYDLLYPEYFESDANQWIVSQIFNYYTTYKRTPTLDVLKVNLQNVEDELLHSEVINCLREVYKYTDSSDLGFVKDTIVQFCVNQELKGAILRSVDLLKLEKYDDIKQLVDTALKKGRNNDIGLQYNDDIEARYVGNTRHPVSTGQNSLDDLMKGGLAGGELGVVLAPSGIGKSWILAHLGAAAMKSGKHVVHYTLELNGNYVAKRYDSIHTGIGLDQLENHIDQVKRKLQSIPGTLLIQTYPTKGVSIMGLRAHIDKLKMLGKPIDLVIIDYADLLKFSNANFSRKDEALQSLYEEIRGWAGELNIPIWTASQTNRSALEEDVIDTDKISESYGKVMTADFIMSLSRKAKDKATSTGRIFISKSRLGADGIVLPTKLDTDCGVLVVYDANCNEGKKILHNTPSDDQYDKARLGAMYKVLFDNKSSENN